MSRPTNRVDLEAQDVTVSDIPANRRDPDVDADAWSLIQELYLVIERHEVDLTPAEIVAVLFETADSYAEVMDVTRQLHIREGEAGQPVGAMWFPDADPADPEFFDEHDPQRDGSGIGALVGGHVEEWQNETDRELFDIGPGGGSP